MRIKAIRIHQTGGPDALQYEDVDLPEPGAGEVRVRHRAIGLNFIDIYVREGLYPAKLPVVLGMEAAGLVEAVGPGVTNLSEGARVAYAQQPGAYAEAANIPAARLIVLPDAISYEVAAAIMLKGMTAEYLLRRTYRVERGQTILVHAAAGGVGLLLCQWAEHLGARVIGTVSTPRKAELARANGCAHVLIDGTDDIEKEVSRLTQGKGLPVVYDSVGQATLALSFACLSARGMLVSYGNSSGAIASIDMRQISARSNYITRPSLRDYIATREELEVSAGALFDVVTKGVVKISINQRYALAEAARAQRDLAARRTTGASILIP